MSFLSAQERAARDRIADRLEALAQTHPQLKGFRKSGQTDETYLHHRRGFTSKPNPQYHREMLEYQRLWEKHVAGQGPMPRHPEESLEEWEADGIDFRLDFHPESWGSEQVQDPRLRFGSIQIIPYISGPKNEGYIAAYNAIYKILEQECAAFKH